MPSARALRAGRAVIELSFLDNTQKGLRRLEARMKAIGQGFTKIGRMGLAAGGAVTGAFLAAAKVFASSGDEVQKMAIRSGVSATALSELGFAAEQSGSNLQAVEKGIRGMARNIVDANRGLSTAKDNFSDLGVSIEELNNLSPDKQFELLVQRLSEIEDPTMRAGLAMKLFGRAGSELLPLLENGSKGIAELREEARQLGITISEEDAQAAAALTDAMNRLWRQVKAVAFSIGAAVSGPLTRFQAAISPIAKTILDWVNNNRKLIGAVAGAAVAVMGIGAAFIGVGLSFTLASIAAGGFATVIGLVGSVLGAVLSPLGLVVGALVALAAWFATSTETGRQMVNRLAGWFGKLADLAKDTFSGIADALSAGDLALAAEVLWAGLKLAWLNGTQYLREKWVDLKTFVVRIGTDMAFGIRKAWVSMIAHVRKAWMDFKSWWADAWDVVVTALAEIGESEGVRADLQAQLHARISEREADSKAKEKEVDAERDKALAELDAKNENARLSQELNAGFELANQQQDMRDAQSAFAEAQKKAAQAADAARKDREKKLAKGKLDPIVAAGLATASNAGGMASGGIFDTRLARQMFGRSRNEELDELRKIRKAVQRRPGDDPGLKAV